MNTESINCRLRAEGEPLQEPGDFKFDEDREYLYIVLPGRKSADAIRIRRGAQGGDRVWGWDGNEEAPTLEPSILDHNHWHGYLHAGKPESC